ncbi:hypothetical protein HCB17_22715 [Salinispora arenicola]|uniref:hypothetical protein n=1 Tax=Salinispora arenicola TaxID=168697 RepID=UPI00142F685F|nr:hypothetical protein [Salinispora arenicola]NIL43627.1 hypothetical protein [Salinispora arenicola]
MTTGGFREVDHDLLADYVGGALTGAPEEVTVARLVEGDPAWAQAYARLASAVADVRADLRACGSVEEMPAAVADRIHTALAAAGDAPADAPYRPSGTVVPAQPHASSRRPGGAPPTGTAGTTGPGRRRRRWRRIGAPVALAAVAVTTVGLLGLDQFGGQGVDSGGSTNETSVQAAVEPVRTAAPPERTGTDYQREDLAVLAKSQRPFTAEGPMSSVGGEIQGDRVAGPIGLDRLMDPGALETCLVEIRREHGTGQLTVDMVDYARFEGQPALVVRFTDATGARWAWVSGPECGVPGSGSDTRYRTRVG